ncbi:MAG: site-specific integrase [Pseudomonadota bacterium]|nr:site-specific integrase [Pseudomonadota bacterium]
MDITEALEQSQPGMVKRLNLAIQKRQLNHRTEQTYLHWISRFVLFHDLKDPQTMAQDEQNQFLGYLADRLKVSRARLNQARQALAFFYEDVLDKSPEAAVA